VAGADPTPKQPNIVIPNNFDDHIGKELIGHQEWNAKLDPAEGGLPLEDGLVRSGRADLAEKIAQRRFHVGVGAEAERIAIAPERNHPDRGAACPPAEVCHANLCGSREGVEGCINPLCRSH
jgi:hypothetical protein